MMNQMKNKTDIYQLVVPITDFKMHDDESTFTCYGNVKNYIDHAEDRSVDGCFVKTIERHLKNGTMPKMFWMHNPFDLPVGAWKRWEEDDKGLFMEGKLSDTSMGRDIKVLAMDNALDSFSIGYRLVDGEYNEKLQCYDLKEVDVLEVSWVNFACNEASTLQSIKSNIMQNGDLTKADLRRLLKSSRLGLSSRDVERITSNYNPDKTDEIAELYNMLAKCNFCN